MPHVDAPDAAPPPVSVTPTALPTPALTPSLPYGSLQFDDSFPIPAANLSIHKPVSPPLSLSSSPSSRNAAAPLFPPGSTIDLSPAFGINSNPSPVRILTVAQLRALPSENLTHWPALSRSQGRVVINRTVPQGTRMQSPDDARRRENRMTGQASGDLAMGASENPEQVPPHPPASETSETVPDPTATSDGSLVTDESMKTTRIATPPPPPQALFGPDVAALLSTRIAAGTTFSPLASGTCSPTRPTPLSPVPPATPATAPPADIHVPPTPGRPRTWSSSLPEAWWAPTPSVRAAAWSILKEQDASPGLDSDDEAEGGGAGVLAWSDGGGFTTRLGSYVFSPPFAASEVAYLRSTVPTTVSHGDAPSPAHTPGSSPGRLSSISMAAHAPSTSSPVFTSLPMERVLGSPLLDAATPPFPDLELSPAMASIRGHPTPTP